MKNEWAQAQKDAAHLGNFLRSLARAGEVFAQVAEAEVKLTFLNAKVKATEVRVENALSDAILAEVDSKERVAVANDRAGAAEASLSTLQHEVATKRTALEEEAERDRLAFVEFKAKLAGEKETAEKEHKTRMKRMATAEEVARASLEAVSQQRERMIADLQTKETPDATPA